MAVTDLRRVPPDLLTSARWVTWRLLSGKKPPVGPDGMPLPAWKDPAGWMTPEAAASRLAGVHAPRGEAGVGFMLGDGWAGIDLDDCRDPASGDIDARARAVLALCEGAYSEVSPSGRGVKVFGRGSGWVELTFRDGRVDVQRKASGYFCVTGDALPGGAGLPDLPLDTVESHFGASRDAADRPREGLPAVVRPGAQNVELFREACRHARDGKTEAEIAAIVRAVAAERCPPAPGSPPWSDGDFRVIARSAARYRPAEDPFPQTESGDAEFFAKLHSDLVRHDWRRKRWVRFDGVRWAPQAAGEVERLALEAVRARGAAAVRAGQTSENWKERLKWAVSGESAARRSHLLDLAKLEPQIADDGERWDEDPWLLGVPNGVLDLRTGELREGRAEDRVTMQTRAVYDPAAACPLWEATVADVLKDSPELVPYLQRALGYSLTGDCREETFFLLTGGGRNGKGTVINTVGYVLGDYADDLAFHTLEKARDGDRTTNDIAKLVHRRFVTASESSGARLNEARLKQVTGRDPVTARFLYAEEFTFVPEFKLWLSVNHLPAVHDDSAGFWSRPHRVPFLQSYLGRENMGLKDALKLEGPGVLAWLVRGCLEWQRAGLDPPPAVRAAVAEYRLGQEPLARFYEDCCVLARGAGALGNELRGVYLRWCDERRIYGDRRLGPQRFSSELVKRVGPPERTRSGMRYNGIGLVSADGGAPSQGAL